jgi:hypothetical protein
VVEPVSPARPTLGEALPVEVHAPPFSEYWYPVTPTLSLEALQLAVALVAETELNVGVPGVVGATLSSVVNDPAALGLLVFPAASLARTANVYAVALVSPTRLKVAAALPVLVHAPPFSEYWYPVTPTLSVDGVQLAVALVAVIDVKLGVPGAVGAPSSSVLTRTLALGALKFTAWSRARIAML